jgi:UDP-N-acetylglucosamine 2-epimerase
MLATMLSRLVPREPALEGVLLLSPNHDPGREIIAATWAEAARAGAHTREHLPRAAFLALLRRLATRGGYLIGNSSAGLIEAAALGVTVVDVGPRQSGRERPVHVIHLPDPDSRSLARACGAAVARTLAKPSRVSHPYGDGRAGPRIASLLARVDPHDPALLRKHNTY